MALDGIPSDATVVGKIEIALVLSGDGIGTAYGVEGMTNEAAIGYLTIVTDRLREERSLQWDTCPGCGEPWDSHEDDDGPDLYDQEEDK